MSEAQMPMLALGWREGTRWADAGAFWLPQDKSLGLRHGPYGQAVHAGLGILPGTTSDHGGCLATWGHPSGQTVRRKGSRS